MKKTYRLTPMQEGLLFHSIVEPASGVYVIQWLCRIREPLDLEAFRGAWERLIRRHDILRTRFEWEGREIPVQIVETEAVCPLIVHDWRVLSPPEQHAGIEDFMTADRARGVSLGEAPVFRLAVFQMGDSEFSFVWTYHHIVVDGATARLIFEELFTLYQAFTEDRSVQLPAPGAYSEYIDWLARQDFLSSRAYWESLLQGVRLDVRLPELSRQKGTEGGRIYLSESLRLDRKTKADVDRSARIHGVRPNILIQSAWSLVLAHYSACDDVVYGVIRSCRRSTMEGASSIAGMFINNLPVRIHLGPTVSLHGLITAIQSQNAELRRLENTPLALIQQWAGVPNGAALFQSLYIYDSGTYNEYFHAKGGRWRNFDLHEHNHTHYPITFLAFDGEDLHLRLEYDSRRFDAQMIRRMLESVRVLLQAMIQDPQVPALDLPFLSPEELAERAVWNRTDRDYGPPRTLMDLFHKQTQRTPNAPALLEAEGGRRLTYSELEERSDRLGCYLQRLGVGPESLVGVFVERSLEMLVGIYGILKAGGAYVPLDPDYPSDRLAFMMEDARTPVVLTVGRLVGRLPAGRFQVVRLDSDSDAVSAEEPSSFFKPAEPTNPAYVIYTSGSTGRPKGVINEHRGIVNRLLWMQEEYPLGPEDRVLQKTPFSFDVSVWELFWPLQAGACLVIARPGGHRDSAYLMETIRRHRITTLHFVPSMLQLFLDEPGVKSCVSLRRVFCSGEALSPELERRFFLRSTAELHNLYGPTEAAVDVTYWACRRHDDRPVVPIGRPVANTQIYVLSPRMHPVPVGVTGELYIGGVQVARGYLNRPELTRDRFIPDPFRTSPGARLYRTGDVARYLPDGAIEYLGRVDFQVKIRGLRVELGEIEARLEETPGVAQSAVILREDAPGDQRLVAYIVAQPGAEVPIATLRDHLHRVLPDYMVPHQFVLLDQMPLTASGKTDRRSLPKPAPAVVPHGSLGPRDAAEARVAAVWCDLLGLQSVGIRDNFFDLGGHSLLVMRMIGRLRMHFDNKLSVTDVFRYPTVEQLAAFLSGANEPTGPKVHCEQGLRQRAALKQQRRSARSHL